MTESKQKTESKVFQFAMNGNHYTIKSTTKEGAVKFLKEEHGVDIKNCIEVPESDWDIKNITLHTENNSELEAFVVSIRDLINPDGSQLLHTNDPTIVD